MAKERKKSNEKANKSLTMAGMFRGVIPSKDGPVPRHPCEGSPDASSRAIRTFMAYVDGYGGGTNHGDAGVNFESTENESSPPQIFIKNTFIARNNQELY